MGAVERPFAKLSGWPRSARIAVMSWHSLATLKWQVAIIIRLNNERGDKT